MDFKNSNINKFFIYLFIFIFFVLNMSLVKGADVFLNSRKVLDLDKKVLNENNNVNETKLNLLDKVNANSNNPPLPNTTTIPVPLILEGLSGKNGLLIKSLGGYYSPFLTWQSNNQKFSIRSDVNYLYFGTGDENGFSPEISLSKDGNLIIGAAQSSRLLLFGYQYLPRAGLRYNPANQKLEFSHNVNDPTSWQVLAQGTTTIIYQSSTLNIPVPLTLANYSGGNGLILKNLGGGINAPFVTWQSNNQKFSIRSDVNYLYFGIGDTLGFKDVLSISKDGDIVFGGENSKPIYFSYNRQYKAGLRYNPANQKLEYSHNVNNPSGWQVLDMQGTTTIINQGNEIFKDERMDKGVVSFPKVLTADGEPIIFHGGGAQVIGRNAYYDQRAQVWKYYKGDASAYAIVFGGGNETLNEVETRMRFQAAPVSDEQRTIRWETALSITQDGNVIIGGGEKTKMLYFGYQYTPKAGLRYNPANQKLEFSHNVNDPTSWQVLAQGTTTIIYQSSTLNIPVPLTLANYSGGNGLILKNLGGGINAPFITWQSNNQKFSIRSDVNYLYFGIGDTSGFKDVLSISKDGDVIIKKFGQVVTGYNYYYQKVGMFENKNINLPTGVTLKQKDYWPNIGSVPGDASARLFCDNRISYVDCQEDVYAANANDPMKKYDLFVSAEYVGEFGGYVNCQLFIRDNTILNTAPNTCKFYPAYIEYTKNQNQIVQGGNQGGNLRVERNLNIGGELKFDNGVFIGTRVILNGTRKVCNIGGYNIEMFVENSKIKFKFNGQVQEAILKPQLVGENAEAFNYNRFYLNYNNYKEILISWGYVGRPDLFFRMHGNSQIASDDSDVSAFVFPEQVAYILVLSGDSVEKRGICAFD